MNNMFEKLTTSNPDKYPSRMGKKWDNDETEKLLQSIKNKKSYETISIEHERTIGGISSQIKKVALEYYSKDIPFEEIEVITGLNKEQINEAIKRQKNKINSKKSNINIDNNIDIDMQTNTSDNIITNNCNCKEELTNIKLILSDIQNKLDLILRTNNI